VLITGIPWETVLSQMTWSRYEIFRTRATARAKALRGEASEPQGPPPTNTAEWIEWCKRTGGKIPGLGTRPG
jgi:hypothetical protein